MSFRELSSLTLTFALVVLVGFGQNITGASKVICPKWWNYSVAPSMPRCIKEFIKDMQEWTGDSKTDLKVGQMLKPRDKAKNIKVPKFAVCCALGKLRNCIFDDVQSICEENANKAAKTAQKLALLGIESFGLINTSNSDQFNCDLDEWYYDVKHSPLCWSLSDQLTGASLLLLLLFVLSCCCCACGIGHQRKTQRSPEQVVTNQFSWKIQNPTYHQLYDSVV